MGLARSYECSYNWPAPQEEHNTGSNKHTNKKGANNMPLVVEEAKQFELCPDGPQEGVIVAVVDRGMVTSEFAGKKKVQHKVSLIIESEYEEETDDGPLRFLLIPRLTVSVNEQATMRKVLEAALQRPLTEEETKGGWDIEPALLGKPIGVTVEHKKGSDNKMHANITHWWKTKNPIEPSGQHDLDFIAEKLTAKDG